MKVLAVVAHPDDEILGIGGTLLKHVAKGDKVYICVVTRAFEPLWSKKDIKRKLIEQKKVDRLLGVEKRFNLDLPTTKLNTIPHGELNGFITKVIDGVKPRVVYTHYENDLNYDHTLVFRACMVATKPPKKISLYCFETISETEWNNKPFLPNIWVDISGFIEKKIKAFQIYRSEVKPFPHSRNAQGIRTLARKRGLEIGAKFAEALMLVRDIRS